MYVARRYLWNDNHYTVTEKKSKNLVRDAEKRKADEQLDEAMMRIEQVAIIEGRMYWRARSPSFL